MFRNSFQAPYFPDLINFYCMYLRFRTSFVDSYHDKRYGIFQAAAYLRHSGIMCHYEKEWLEDVWRWFADNLDAPTVYRTEGKAQRAICWFKPTAQDQIRKVFEMITILEQYGMRIEKVTADNPGYVLYEDEHQVAAIPHRTLAKLVR